MVWLVVSTKQPFCGCHTLDVCRLLLQIQKRVQELKDSTAKLRCPSWMHFSPPCGKVSGMNGNKDKALNREDFT